jgi:hypothetical protein
MEPMQVLARFFKAGIFTIATIPGSETYVNSRSVLDSVEFALNITLRGESKA